MGVEIPSVVGEHLMTLAGRAWPDDDLARRALKTRAVLQRAGVFGRDLDTITPAEVADVERVFGLIDVGDLEAWNRGDGTYELRSATLGKGTNGGLSRRSRHRSSKGGRR